MQDCVISNGDFMIARHLDVTSWCDVIAGDKRSFAMVKIAAHRLAGEKRKGWAVVNVVAEMCEALVR